VLEASGGVSASHLGAALFITGTNLCFGSLRVLEKVRFGRAIDAVEIGHPPLFILGHWRTGTTFLHNLLAQDPALGSISTLETAAPGFYLTASKTLRPFFESRLPKTRHMDNMGMSLELPQEEEIALARVSPHSVYHGWSFPRRLQFYFDRYALFEDIPEAAFEGWKSDYIAFLKRTTYHAHGRRLVLKNPLNTCRIPVLLELFPRARFIYIYRNPYTVFASTMRLHLEMLRNFALQNYDPHDVEAFALYAYKRMMKRYLQDRARIPDGHLVEVKFEEFEKDPLGQARRIYADLDLPGFDEAEPAFQSHIDSQSSHRKNEFHLESSEIERIKREWGFAFAEWPYDVPLGITGS
jgi:hypothetical protein